MLKIMYVKVGARGEQSAPEELELAAENIVEGAAHAKVYSVLSSLNDPEKRPEGLPECQGQSTLVLMGYKRPGDKEWHSWRQTLFSANYRGQKLATDKPEPMAQGVDLESGPPEVSLQPPGTGVGPNNGSPAAMANGVNFGNSPCANGGC